MIRKLQEKYRVEFVLGNREIDMIERKKGNRDFWKEELHNGNLYFAYQDLTEEDLQWLEKMPENIVVEFPNHKKGVISHISNTEEVKKLATENKVSIVISGHSHFVANEDHRKDGGIWYINPGSVGLTEDGISYGGTYGILNVTNEKVEYEQCKFKADEKTIEEIYAKIYGDEQLKKSYWPSILDLSMRTGRNMASIFFGEKI